jgi:hypothetical protein
VITANERSQLVFPFQCSQRKKLRVLVAMLFSERRHKERVRSFR